MNAIGALDHGGSATAGMGRPKRDGIGQWNVDETSEMRSRDGRYRLVLTLTDRDLPVHGGAWHAAPELIEVENGRSLFALDQYHWNAINSVPWGDSGFQLRLSLIDRDVEPCPILDPAFGRFCLSDGFAGQMWGDETPDRDLRWQFDWAGSNASLAAQCEAG